jgi:hypothetical protein
VLFRARPFLTQDDNSCAHWRDFVERSGRTVLSSVTACRQLTEEIDRRCELQSRTCGGRPHRRHVLPPVELGSGNVVSPVVN